MQQSSVGQNVARAQVGVAFVASLRPTTAGEHLFYRTLHNPPFFTSALILDSSGRLSIGDKEFCWPPGLGRLLGPEGAGLDSPGQRPGFEVTKPSPALKGRHKFRRSRPFKATCSSCFRFPGRCPGLSNRDPAGHKTRTKSRADHGSTKARLPSGQRERCWTITAEEQKKTFRRWWTPWQM